MGDYTDLTLLGGLGTLRGGRFADVYRIRANGKWWEPTKTFTLSEVFSIFRRSTSRFRDAHRQKDQKLKDEQSAVSQS